MLGKWYDAISVQNRFGTSQFSHIHVDKLQNTSNLVRMSEKQQLLLADSNEGW